METTPLTPNTGAAIPLTEAITLTTAYRAEYPHEVKAFFMGSNRIKELLQQPGCIGIRIYNGWNAEEKCFQNMLVGVDVKGCDMTDLIMDRMSPCPTICDPASPLV